MGPVPGARGPVARNTLLLLSGLLSGLDFTRIRGLLCLPRHEQQLSSIIDSVV